MCGIVGYALKDGVAAPDLSPALTAIHHRGPDGFDTFLSPEHGIGLGHVRLSIIDLSEGGRQPMASRDGRYVMAYVGELYDYRAHRDRLEAEGHTFQSTSDTEVLLRLLETEGTDVLPRLNGMFSISLLDRETGELTLIRDALGVKPLYVATTRDGIWFSSEVKAIVALGVHMGPPDAASILRYLTYLWCPGEGMPAQGVRKLAPGHAMVIRGGEVQRHWRWYDLPAVSPQPKPMTVDDAVQGIRQHLRTAVERQMVADVPVGAFLSGGLDSSSIVAFARQINPDIRCFTIEAAGGAEAGTADDLPYAHRVADHLKVPLEIVTVDSARMAQGLEDMVAQLDEPLADPAPLNVLYISQLARDGGIKVLLSGAGGDDLFTGYRRHRAIRLERFWRWLPRSARSRLEGLTGRLDRRNATFRRVAKLFDGAALDGDVRLARYFAWAAPETLLPLLSPDLRAEIAGIAPEQPMLDLLAEMPEGSDRLDRMLTLEQRFFLADHNLTYTDKMGMAASIETRVPFLDIDLVAYAATLPNALKQRGQVGKWILKKAMEPDLPHDVIYRPKAGFGAPLRRWIRHELDPLVRDVLSEDSLKHRGLFDPAAVQALIRTNAEGAVDASYTILSLMCIELWFRKFG